MITTFKERIKNTIIDCSKIYYKNFIKKEFLIYSKSFANNSFYTITAKKDNYLHLTGLNTRLSPNMFFDKCFSGTLQENDFEINSKQQKGSVRRKIKILREAMNMPLLINDMQIEENFEKNNILCSIATANASFTLGFTLLKNSKPKTLLKGFQLTNPGEIDLFIQHDKETNENKIIINKIELHSIFDEIKLQVPHYFNEFNETNIK